MEKRLEKMEKLQKPKRDKDNMKLSLDLKTPSGKEVIKIKDLCKKFDDKILLDKANFLLTYGEKIALIGENGTGKSTLLKIILKNVDCSFNEKDYFEDSGRAELGASIKLGYLPQKVRFNNEENTVFRVF